MWSKVGMGGEHYKHTKFHQNPRGDSKFLVDLTQNDPKPIFANFVGIDKKQCLEV